MKVLGFVHIAAVCAAVLALPLAAGAQEHPSAVKPSAAKSEKETPGTMSIPPGPHPGPEHQHLAKVVGKWKAVMRISKAPGQPPVESEGVAENRSICQGLWIETTFKSGPKMPYEGHGLTGYDPMKKKYVGVWVDSWSPSIATSESEVDPSGKIFTATMQSPDSTGAMRTTSTREEWKDDNTRVWRMFPGPRPEGQPTMEIIYTRQGSRAKATIKKG